MKTNKFELLSKTINSFSENIIFLIAGAIILSFPMIATIGQFLDTHYFQTTVPILLLYWPGSDYNIKVQTLVRKFIRPNISKWTDINKFWGSKSCNYTN